MAKTVEFIEFRVEPENVETFLKARQRADDFLKSATPGHEKTELYDLGNKRWLAMIHWASENDMAAAQKITSTASEVSQFVASANEFVQFQQGSLKYST